MDGSPQLLTNIQFAEAKKGYDRDQVDNFLRELSGKVGELQDMLRTATQRAEAAEIALAEAEKARSAAESAAAKAKAEVASATATPAARSNDLEAATGVLAMAQKTADATVADAEAKGREIVADARDRAAAIVVEVEREADRLKAAARADADKMVAERVTVIEADVERLSAQRDGLQLDVDLLRHYLDEHRAKIRAGLDDINRILDQPGGLMPDRAPEMGGTSSDTRIDSVARPARSVEPAPDSTSDATALPAGAEPMAPPADTGPAPEAPGGGTGTSGSSDAPSVVAPPSPTDASPSSPAGGSGSSSPGPGAATALAATAADDSSSDVPEISIVTVEDLAEPAPRTDPGAEFPAVKAPGFFGADEPEPTDGTGSSSIDLTGPSLFSQQPEESTQAYDVLADEAGEAEPGADSSTLGHVDDDADEAMRAFFEQDLDQPSKDDKPRGFLRRK